MVDDTGNISPLMAQSAAARAAGYSWDEINTHIAEGRDKAMKAGYSSADVDKYLGIKTEPPAPLTDSERMPIVSQQEMEKSFKSFQDWLQPSPEAVGKAFAPVENVGQWIRRSGYQLGDMAKIFGGGIVGAIKGVSDVMTGKITDPDKMAEIAENAAPLMASGLRFGRGGVPGAKIGGGFPHAEDVVDSATSLAGLKTKDAVTKENLTIVARNLGKNYVETGEHPIEAAQRAATDPVVRQQMVLPPEPKVEKGSAEAGDMVIPELEGAAPHEALEGPHPMAHEEPLPGVEIDNTHDVPYGAGASNTGNVVHIDKSIPQFDDRVTNAAGEPLDLHKYLAIHETKEVEAMKRGMSYEDAHYHVATPAERAALEADGGNWKVYSEVMDEHLKQTEHEKLKGKDIPENLYLKPYPHKEELLLEKHGAGEATAEKEQAKTPLSDLRVAFRAKNGDITSGGPEHNHADVAAHVGWDKLEGGSMGFTDKEGRFYTRSEAHDLMLPETSEELKEKKLAVAGGGAGNIIPPGSPRLIPGSPNGPMKWGDPFTMMKQYVGAREEGGWIASLLKYPKRFYQEIIDPDQPYNRLAEAAMKGKNIPDAENPAFLHSLAKNAHSRAWYMITEKMIDTQGTVTGKGLMEILKPVTGQEGDYFTYAMGRWAQEKATQGKETGIPLDLANDAVKLGDGRGYRKVFDEMVEWQNGTLKYAYERGAISGDFYNTAITQNKARIPGYRYFEDEGAGGPARKGKSLAQEFKGSERQIRPIFPSLVQDALRRIMVSDNIMADRLLADGAKLIGEASRVGIEKIVNLDPAEWFDLNIDPDLLGWEDMGSTAEQNAKMASQVVKVFGGLKSGEVPIVRSGKMERWKFKDPEVTKLLRGYDAPMRSLLFKMVAGMTRITRSAIVNTMVLPLHIAMFDMPFQYLTKPTGRFTPADFGAGLLNGMFNTEKWHQYLRSGGAENVYETMTHNPRVQALLKNPDRVGPDNPAVQLWNVIKYPFHLLKVASQLIMNAQKGGRYIRGQKQGETPIRSAVSAQMAAFHRSTFGGPTLKSINAIVPFTGAIVNSLTQSTRAMFGIGKQLTGEKNMASRTALKAMALITIPSLAIWAASKDKEWYKALPEWQKDNYLPIHVGEDDGSGTTYLWKFPPFLSMIYWGIPRRIAEKYINDNPAEMNGMTSSLAEAMIPPVGTTAFGPAQPIVEHIAHYSFFRHQPIVTDTQRKELLTPEQYSKYSTETAKSISKFTNDLPILKEGGLSPQIVDNYIQQWSGGLGTMAIRYTEAVLQSQGIIKQAAPAQNISDLPGFSSFVERYPSMSAAPIQQFYDASTHLDQVHGSLVKTLEEGNFARFKEIVQENPTAAMIHWRQLKSVPAALASLQKLGPEYGDELAKASSKANVEAAEKILSVQKLMENKSKYIKLVEAVPTGKMTATEKRHVLDDAYAWMQKAAEVGNKYLVSSGIVK